MNARAGVVLVGMGLTLVASQLFREEPWQLLILIGCFEVVFGGLLIVDDPRRHRLRAIRRRRRGRRGWIPPVERRP